MTRLDCFVKVTWHKSDKVFNHNPMFLIKHKKLSSIKVNSEKITDAGIIKNVHFGSLNRSDLSGNLNATKIKIHKIPKNLKNERTPGTKYLDVKRKRKEEMHDKPM